MVALEALENVAQSTFVPSHLSLNPAPETMNEQPKHDDDCIDDVNALAELLVRFAEQDKPKEQGTLPSRTLSLARGEREQFAVMDGIKAETYDEDRDFQGYCEEPAEVVDVSLLDEDEDPES